MNRIGAPGYGAMVLAGAGILLPDDHLQEIAKDFEVESGRVSSLNIEVRGDAPIETLKSIAAMADVYLGVLFFALGGDPESLTFDIRIFRDEDDFRRQATLDGAPDADAYYIRDGRNHEIRLPVTGQRGAEWLERILAHEFTHAYIDRVFGVHGPLWFSEGMAEYFSNLKVGRAGRVGPGGLNENGIAILRANKHDLLHLKVFTQLGRDIFYGSKFAVCYAHAWVLVRFYLIGTRKLSTAS